MPGIPSDRLAFHPESRHIVVIHNNNFFSLPVYGSAGEQLSAEQIETSLGSIVAGEAGAGPGPGVGALTSQDRDTWADHHSMLVGDYQNSQAGLVLCCGQHYVIVTAGCR